jgi:hypothetical protein
MEDERDPAQTTLCDDEKYKDYSDVDSDSQSILYRPLRSRLCRPVIILLSVVVVLTPILYLTISHHVKTASGFDQCGTTATEARSRGCVFEMTGFAWLTKECHDPTTEDEFIEYIVANDIKLFRDMNYTEEVTIEEVRRGNSGCKQPRSTRRPQATANRHPFVVFVRQQYHLTHCLFLIKKMHRALERGKPIDGIIKPAHHTEHCVGQLLKPHGFRKDDIQFSYTKFPYCGKPGGFNIEWETQGEWTDY